MKPPYCKICCHEHGTREPHILQSISEPEKLAQDYQKLAPVPPTEKQLALADAKLAKGRAWREANRDKYNARQREYMRRRRAKE